MHINLNLDVNRCLNIKTFIMVMCFYRGCGAEAESGGGRAGAHKESQGQELPAGEVH